MNNSSKNAATATTFKTTTTIEFQYVPRTPTPPPTPPIPPPPPPPKLTKSHSIISYEYIDCDSINFCNKALMPPLDNYYTNNQCCPSIYAAVAASSHTLDNKRRHHKHNNKCQHHHQHQQQQQSNHHYHHNHQHHHNHNHHHHSHQTHQAQFLNSIKNDADDNESDLQLLRQHHKSSPSIDLHSPQSSQKPLKSSTSSLSFLFGIGGCSKDDTTTTTNAVASSNNNSHHHTPRSSKSSSTSSKSPSIASSPSRSSRAKSSSSSASSSSKWRNSSFHSCDDLDAAAKKCHSTSSSSQSQRLSAEKKVVKSIKYWCACTGATLRNLSKRTKDLHAKNYHGYSEPTWRVWGEEREKNAIFTVYLKKVRYHRPTPTASLDTGDGDADGEISHLAWETVRVRFVKAATLERLVEALATDDGELESTFINVFLSTYRTFSTPKEVLNLLIRRYDTLNEKHEQELKAQGGGINRGGVDYYNIDTSASSFDASTYSNSSDYDPTNASIHEQHKRTLVSALHVWLDGFPEDWNEENLRIIKIFAEKRLPRSDLDRKVHHRLERILRQQYERQQYCSIGSGVSSDTSLTSSTSSSISTSTTAPWLSGGSSSGLGLGGSNSSHHLVNGMLNMGSYGNVSGGILSQQYVADLSDQLSVHLALVNQRRSAYFMQSHRFPHVPVRYFAQQLTRMDAELFKRLIPHQCLGAAWSRRDKTPQKQSGTETVIAQINQFNDVVFRVFSSILIEPRLKPQERSLYIAAWIDIAQELRLLKNFSSLKAIISALQSHSIHRLVKTWAALSTEKIEIFEELAQICSEENNAWRQREVLMREGTAKFADTVGENDSHLQKIIQKQSTRTSHGTIPYLGLFLYDLTMIHTAIPDTIGDEGFINFDKKRKEFEVLAQIKLLQGAANTYTLHEDPNFDIWFASMPTLNETEARTLSYQYEAAPPTQRKSIPNLTNNNNNSTTTNTNTTAATAKLSSSGNNSIISGNCSAGGAFTMSGIGGGGGSNGHRKTDSIASTSSSGAGSSHIHTDSRYNSRHNSLDRGDSQLQQPISILSASSSVSNLSQDSSNSGGQQQHQHQMRPNSHNSRLPHSQSANGMTQTTNSNSNKNGSPMINGQCKQTPDGKTPTFYIIRVTYETENVELDGIVLYKSIMLGNNERAPQVIRNAMLKLSLEGDPESYTLAQVLPDKELVMPKDANVYYAVNTNYDLNFILRPKKSGGGGGKNGAANTTS